MSIFSKLFKPAASDKPVAQRMAKIDRLEEPQLLEIVEAAEPAELRIAAAKRLKRSKDLVRIAGDTHTPPNLQIALHKRLAELIDAKELALEEFVRQARSQKLMLEVSAYSNLAGPYVVDRIDDETLLAELAQLGLTTQVRQAASERVESKELLDELLVFAKQKDKSVYRIVKTKLKRFKAEKAELDEKKQELESLCNQAEHLAKHKVDEIFRTRLQQIQDAWQSLASSADAELSQRFDAAIAACEQLKNQEVIEQQQAEQALAAEKLAKKDVYDLLARVQQMIAQFYQDKAQPLDQEQIPALQDEAQHVLAQATQRDLDCARERRTIEQLLTQLQALSELHSQGEAFVTLLERYPDEQAPSEEDLKRLKRFLKLGSVLDNAARPAQLDNAAQRLAHWQQQSELKKAQEKEQLDKFNELLRKGNWAVNHGHPGRARAILQDLKELDAGLSDTPAFLQRKLDELEQAVNKLGDWHEFAVTPKKEALVKAMQALVAAEIEPKDLAEKIQTLQQQWKELSRGGQNQDEQLWQSFHQAAQQAYEPCKVFFEEQNQEREKNSVNRRTLIQQLEKYLSDYAWDNADWGEVEKTLKIAREAWQSYWPVVRKDTKALQRDFDALMDQLYGNLNHEYEQNHNKKLAIIEQAAQLKDMNDIKQAIDSAKRFQAQWKLIGRCKRKDEQVLWKQFREHCDAVFNRREAENQQLKEQLANNEAQALHIIEMIEHLTELTGDAFFTAKNGLEDLLKDFDSLGEFSKANGSKLKARLRQATEAADTQAENLRAQAERESWLAALDLAADLRRAELALPEVPAELQDQCEGDFEAQQRWPGNAKAVLSTRMQQLREGEAIDSAAADQTCRMICIKAEVALGVDSPDEDKALRMQYQVEQLQSNWQQAQDADLSNQLLEQWLANRGASDEQYSATQERLLRVLGW